MTSPALQVTPSSMRELAQRCERRSSQVAPVLPAVSTAAWQASAAAASTVNAGGRKTATAIQHRMPASAGKLTAAARKYQVMDNDGAAALAAVPQGAASITPLSPRGSGADGAAASGFGVPR